MQRGSNPDLPCLRTGPKLSQLCVISGAQRLECIYIFLNIFNMAGSGGTCLLGRQRQALWVPGQPSLQSKFQKKKKNHFSRGWRHGQAVKHALLLLQKLQFSMHIAVRNHLCNSRFRGSYPLCAHICAYIREGKTLIHIKHFKAIFSLFTGPFDSDS